MPAPLSPSSFLRGPSGSKTAQVLCVAFANFLRRHSVLTKAFASSADPTAPPATAYFDPRSVSAFSISFSGLPMCSGRHFACRVAFASHVIR